MIKNDEIKYSWSRSLSTNPLRSTTKLEVNFEGNVNYKLAQKAYPNASINLAKYPWLMDLSSPAAKAAIQEARESVRINGAAFFPDFITGTALQDCVKECHEQNKDLLQIDDEHNIYYDGDDASYPEDHIRNRKVRTRVAVIP